MKKKLSILLLMSLVVLSLIPVSAFAYPGGLLDGHIFRSGAGVTTTLITDNDLSTYYTVNHFKSDNTHFVVSPYPPLQKDKLTINSYQVLGEGKWSLTFTASDNSTISTISTIVSDGTVQSITPVNNVAYIVLTNTSQNTPQKLYEANIYGDRIDLTAPSIPAGFTGAQGSNTVYLNWTANNETDFDHYNIYQDGALIGDTTANNYTIHSLTNGTEYEFAVTSVDTVGNESAKSTSVFLTPLAAPPVSPTGFTAINGNESVTLKWNTVPGADNYNLYRDGSALQTGITVTDATYVMYTDTGLTNGTDYLYGVTAVNSHGESPQATATGKPSATSFGGMILPFNVVDMLKTALSFLSMYGQWIMLALALIFAPVLYGLAFKLLHHVRMQTVESREKQIRIYQGLSEAGKKKYREKYGDPLYKVNDRDERIRAREWESVKKAELRDEKNPVLVARREAARDNLRESTRTDRPGRAGRQGGRNHARS